MSLNDYNILRVIGRGSYGEVHLVTHKKDKKQYVIKKMFVNASAKERKAAEQEAKLLSNLRHPNIVSYKDSFESETGHLYIVMGFAEGGDLYTKLREQKDRKELLSEQQTVRWYIQICMALQYLHDKRILHRDLKTQNIFLTKTKIIKVGDLGIAKVLESGSDMATTLIGTPYYMSPELFANKPYNHKSDVWALGCCMYEMVTLRHAFNAKDINSLMYKILKGKMPPMPEDYTEPLCNLIKDMLNPVPEKRPSVQRILRNPYVKRHIQLFLDESNRKRKTTSERTSRRSSAASSGSTVPHRTSSRKTSSNSQGSTPSPHPPSLAPDPTKPIRQARARSPNIITPSPEAEERRCSPQPVAKDVREISKRTEGLAIGGGDAVASGPPMPEQDRIRNISLSPVPRITTPNEAPQNLSPREALRNDNKNTNNSKLDTENPFYGVVLEIEKVEIHPVREIGKGVSKSDFAVSCVKNRRPLPECPKVADEPGRTEESSSDSLRSSGKSVVSVASSVTSSVANENGAPRVSNARQRRRERHQREKPKTPAILEEIRKSRSTGFKQKIAKKAVATKNEVGGGGKEPMVEKVNNVKSARDVVHIVDGAVQSSSPPVNRTVVPAEEPQRGQLEVEEFMTMLQTTLHLGSDRGSVTSEDGDSPILGEDSEGRQGDLSPVPELPESLSSDAVYKSRPHAGNTPASTPFSYHVPDAKAAPRPVSKGTLRSTQRLMDRIVSLRKDCVRGLGVTVLHRAYEILDANENDDILKERLIGLLGPTQFEQWGGKIWQLKFCEESLFGHCETLTVY